MSRLNDGSSSPSFGFIVNISFPTYKHRRCHLIAVAFSCRLNSPGMFFAARESLTTARQTLRVILGNDLE